MGYHLNMKKFTLCIVLILLLFCTESSYFLVFANTKKYARALDENIYLYRLSTSDNSLSNIICIVEKSYFVEILSDNVDNYKVNYNGIIGYIKKEDVVPVSNIPTTPYPSNIQLTIGSNCNLRSTPTTKAYTSNIITTLYSGETNLQFIGRVFSEEVIDFGGTTWYYVSYNGERGYVYNKYIKSISPIYLNQEETYTIVENEFVTTNPLNNTNSIVIMLILFLPCLCILFILYYPRKHKHISASNTSHEIERY